MTNKRKLRVKALSKKTGMAYQAASNVLSKDPPSSQVLPGTPEFESLKEELITTYLATEEGREKLTTILFEKAKQGMPLTSSFNTRIIEGLLSHPHPRRDKLEEMSFALQKRAREIDIRRICRAANEEAKPLSDVHAGFDTIEEYEQVVLRYKHAGWDTIPWTDPKRRGIGCYAELRDRQKLAELAPLDGPPLDEDRHEEVRQEAASYFFPDGMYTPEIREIEETRETSGKGLEFRKELEALAEKELFRADDPKRLRVGFVWYSPDKVSHIFYARITQLKVYGSGLTIKGKPFLEWRNTIPEWSPSAVKPEGQS